MSEAATGSRDSRGEWQPAARPVTAPIWAWPPRPLETAKWLFGYPGYLFPWNAIYFAIALGTWAYVTPELSRMVEFRIGWIAEIYLRNLALFVLWVGGLHVWLHTFRSQGTAYKLHPKWLGEKSPAFLWRDQLRDNVFRNLVSACTVCTAYEVVAMWGYANGFIAFIDWRTEPVTFVFIVLAIPMWREIHNYWTHRLIHWKPLYRTVHHVHHKNVNIGPWSGLAMHPVEHIINFSASLLFWVVPSHPLMAIFTLQHALLAPAPGHAGFHQLIIKGKFTLPSDYFHYVHHRYFECNYGNPMVPFDGWFGTFHDGSAEGHAKMQERWGENRLKGEDHGRR